MKREIEKLLPHREPFLFVDEIISATKEEIIAVKTFELNEWIKQTFSNHLNLPGTILLESMVQCGGAGVRLLGIAEGTFALARIEGLQFYKEVEYNKQVDYYIRNIKINSKMINQSGAAYLNGIQVMEGSWVSMLLNS